MKILAVDIGGPIIRREAGSSFEEYRSAQPEPDSFESLAKLSEHYQIHLISQCNQELQDVKLDWMARHDFFNRTNLTMEQIHFVRQPQDKAILGKQLGATHFVEDRAEILNHAIYDIDHLFLYRPKYEEAIQYPDVLERARIILSWNQLIYFLFD